MRSRSGAAGAVVQSTTVRRELGQADASAAAVPVVIEVADTTRGAAGPGPVRAARVGRDGGRDHRQRGQDDDEGNDRGVARGALSTS